MEIEEEQEQESSKQQSSGEYKDSNCTSLLPQSASNQTKRKYIKKTYQQFLQKADIEDENINYSKTQTIQITPMYEQLKEHLEFILIGGDFLFKKSQYQMSQQNQNYGAEEQLKLYKDIVYVSKHEDKYLNVSLINKLEGLIDFRNLITSINELLIQISGENHIDILLQFQKILFQTHEVINNVVKLYPNPDDLVELQKKRTEYIRNYGLNFLKENYAEDDFLMMGLTLLNFEKKVPTLTNIAFNQPLVSLIGSNFDQLQTYFMRKGIKEFFDLRTRVLIQSSHLQEFARVRQSKSSHPFTLITYDDITLHTQIELETIYLDFPDELKYDKNQSEQVEMYELGFVMKLNVEPEHLQQIINIRQSNQQDEHNQFNRDILRKEEDICYNMQSQYLIERFYQQELKTLVKNDEFNYFSSDTSKQNQQNQENTDEIKNDQRCKFRFI